MSRDSYNITWGILGEHLIQCDKAFRNLKRHQNNHLQLSHRQ